jgi:hypothetical protein
VSKNCTPEQRVGRAANVTIFLGILFAVIHLLALSGLQAMAQRGYGLAGLAISVGFLGLGYGIRYGSYPALYLTTGGFAVLAVYAVARLAIAGTPAMFVRSAVAVWMLVSLCRAIPDMGVLHRKAAFPLPMSRYGSFFLRRWSRKKGDS